jgi:hypothetical protein
MTAEKPNFKYAKHTEKVDDVGNQRPPGAGDKTAEDNAEVGHNHCRKRDGVKTAENILIPFAGQLTFDATAGAG